MEARNGRLFVFVGVTGDSGPVGTVEPLGWLPGAPPHMISHSLIRFFVVVPRISSTHMQKLFSRPLLYKYESPPYAYAYALPPATPNSQPTGCAPTSSPSLPSASTTTAPAAKRPSLARYSKHLFALPCTLRRFSGDSGTGGGSTSAGRPVASSLKVEGMTQRRGSVVVCHC
ncbi:uncharacterized protein K452DRAFT_285409, partial [Aplosporella prunicola CBS 121167]